jgi:hypothetical protein
MEKEVAYGLCGALFDGLILTAGGAEAQGTLNLISGLSTVLSHVTHLYFMSLILTIFALVFITELVSWIGKSVLLHFVHLLAVHVWLR